MNYELIKPALYSTELEARLLDLKRTLRKLSKESEDYPAGHLKVSQRKGHPEFYHITEVGRSTGAYISAAKKELAVKLAQKDYNIKAIRLVKKEISVLEKYLRYTENGNAIKKFYEGLCNARQALIDPVTLSDKGFAERWSQNVWTGAGSGIPFADDSVSYFTTNGERVRSKSELVIANTLLLYGVPYKYEVPLKLKCINRSENGGETTDIVTFHPDFLCLNVRTRGEFFWEHFGKMDDADYANNTVGKLNLYAENGFLPGRNLIFTMESGEGSLDTRVVEKMIKEFLL